MVLSVPGEVLCSRKVLVLLVTFDLWLSLCFVFVCVCLFVLEFVVVLLLLACWTQAEHALLEYRRLPEGPHPSALVHSSATWSLGALAWHCGPRAWAKAMAE